MNENNIYEEQDMQEENIGEISRKKKIILNLYEWVEEFTIAIAVIVILLSFAVRVVTVSGTSMLPNYRHNDRLIITSYNNEINVGDVVVLVDVLDEPIIKRVIATEGQTVDIDTEKGIVYVNGEALDDSVYGIENGITFLESAAVFHTKFPCTVPKGHIFVLGDNRRVSNDSRYSAIGMVDERKVLGKAFFSIFPFDKIGFTK